jgi:glycosyltransferase involved in cell wall biosynthesis
MIVKPAIGSPGTTRVLRLFSRLNVGGPSIHVILLTAGLSEKGYETRLVVGHESLREGNFFDLAAKKGITCIQMDGLGREIRPLSDFRSLWRLYRMIRAYRPAIVHTHTAKAGVLGRVAAHLAGVPVVVHTFHGHVLRGYFGPLKTAFFRRLEAALSSWSDALIAVSEAVKDDLLALRVAPGPKVRVIPLGLELEPLSGSLPRGALRRESGVSSEAPLVGMVGRLAPIKDVPTFLKAAVLIHEARPEARFAIVGDGEERDLLEREAERLGLAEVVHFHGWHKDMRGVYGDLDVVVNSSLNEGTPVALIEALAAGRPVVATRVGGTPDLLGEGLRGTLVPSGHPEALAQAILEILRSRAPETARAEAGQRYVLARHSVDRLLTDMDGLYRELLAAARST